mmetsp:Transcript_42785/g.112560  ORF Transcript_42785/g.112560 Transcript_42785/m.112560 type:complete len:389 (-) Transcript_42785:279-1445(-)
MCCEATDALLEYIRRSLNLTGLRNLNAPRRLKLRVPVLKEWLQRQGHVELSAHIPDWDPVRKPTGRWKAWEIAYLKPIMDEKAAERQAKRNLLNGDQASAGDIMGGMIRDRHEAAIEGLKALSSAAAPGDDATDDEDDSEEENLRPAASNSQQPIMERMAVSHDETEFNMDCVQDEKLGRRATTNETVTHALGLAISIQSLLASVKPESDAQAMAITAAASAALELQAKLSVPALSVPSWRMIPTALLNADVAAADVPCLGSSALVPLAALRLPPVAAAPASSLPAHQQSEGTSGQSSLVNIVEEDAQLSQLTTSALEKIDCASIMITSSQEARDFMSSQQTAESSLSEPPEAASTMAGSGRASQQIEDDAGASQMSISGFVAAIATP